MAFATVLVVLLKGTPSMLKDAFVPPTGVSKVRPVELFVMASTPGAPVLWLKMARRAPVASFTTLAVTPKDCELM